MVFPIPNHVEPSMCVRYFAPSSLRTKDPRSSIAYSQLIIVWLIIHANSCQILLVKTFLEDVSGSLSNLSNQIQTERGYLNSAP